MLKLLKLRFDKPKLLLAYANALGVLLDEVTFRATPEGIKIIGMDPARVALLDVEFPSADFEVYECKEPTTFTFTVSNFIRLLKLAAETDTIELVFPGIIKTEKVQVSFIGIATRTFYMRSLESPSEADNKPKISFKAKATMQTKQFLQFVNSAQAVSDHIHLTATDEKLSVDAEGDLMGCQMVLSKSALELLDVPVVQKAVFSATYLEEILRTLAETCPNVTLNWSTDKPILLNFGLPSLGKIHFYLAPRIETE